MLVCSRSGRFCCWLACLCLLGLVFLFWLFCALFVTNTLWVWRGSSVLALSLRRGVTGQFMRRTMLSRVWPWWLRWVLFWFIMAGSSRFVSLLLSSLRCTICLGSLRLISSGTYNGKLGMPRWVGGGLSVGLALRFGITMLRRNGAAFLCERLALLLFF